MSISAAGKEGPYRLSLMHLITHTEQRDCPNAELLLRDLFTATEPGSPVGSNQKVFLVGGTGRVGQIVVQGLVDRGYEVVCLARDPGELHYHHTARVPIL